MVCLRTEVRENKSGISIMSAVNIRKACVGAAQFCQSGSSVFLAQCTFFEITTTWTSDPDLCALICSIAAAVFAGRCHLAMPKKVLTRRNSRGTRGSL
eukprot:546108-Pelagomonas_calceolata.AAC.2